jgi:hypothetical protein
MTSTHSAPVGLRPAAIALLWLAVMAAPAVAASTRDLVALSKAGLGDDVLVALVESDDTVYDLDGPQIVELRREGLSERVIVAMIRNGGRRAVDPEPSDETPPSLVIIGETPEPEPVVVQQTSVIVVPYVPIARPVHPRPRPASPPRSGYRGFGRFINDGWVDGRPPSGAR